MAAPKYPPNVRCGGCGNYQTMLASGFCWNCRDHSDLEGLLALARARDEVFRREQRRKEHERIQAVLERSRRAYLDAIGPEAAAKLKRPPRPTLSAREAHEGIRRLLASQPLLCALTTIADPRELWG